MNPTVGEIEEKFNNMRYKNLEARNEISLILAELKNNPPAQPKNTFVDKKQKQKYKFQHSAMMTS